MTALDPENINGIEAVPTSLAACKFPEIQAVTGMALQQSDERHR